LSLRTFLVESTWGYPIISAIHVLGMAWFAGTVLVAYFTGDLRRWRLAGITLVLASGAVLFWLQPRQYTGSISFQLKMVLIVVLMWTKPGGRLSLGLWVAVILASRGIAFF
jgi:hypothetical protein